ncbi:MAG TPA: hypothetical protein ENK57_00180 [Polyangiaceae bacterium]|nr:hypothetical protein [Polyangiaceae bacterium]
MTRLLESVRSLPAIALFGALIAGSAALMGCGPEDCEGCGGLDDPPASPASACVAGEAPATIPALVPGIVLANGMGFSELSEGGGIPLQFGGQGGSHIDVSVRAFVDAGPSATVEFEVESADFGESTVVPFQSCDGQWSQMTGRVFDPPSGDVTLRISVLDSAGAELAMTEMAAYVE